VPPSLPPLPPPLLRPPLPSSIHSTAVLIGSTHHFRIAAFRQQTRIGLESRKGVGIIELSVTLLVWLWMGSALTSGGLQKNIPSITHASTSDFSMARVETTSEYCMCLEVERAQRVVSAMRRSFRSTVSAVNDAKPNPILASSCRSARRLPTKYL